MAVGAVELREQLAREQLGEAERADVKGLLGSLEMRMSRLKLSRLKTFDLVQVAVLHGADQPPHRAFTYRYPSHNAILEVPKSADGRERKFSFRFETKLSAGEYTIILWLIDTKCKPGDAVDAGSVAVSLSIDERGEGSTLSGRQLKRPRERR